MIYALPPEVPQRVVDEYEEEQQQNEAIAAHVGVALFAEVDVERHHHRRRERKQHHWQLSANHDMIDRQWVKYRRQADDQSDVGHVGAEDVAEGQRARIRERGLYAHGELWGAGPEGHHRQAHDEWRDSRTARERRRALDEKLPSGDEEDDPQPTDRQVIQHMDFTQCPGFTCTWL